MTYTCLLRATVFTILTDSKMGISQSTWIGILCSLGQPAHKYDISYSARKLMASILIHCVGRDLIRNLGFETEMDAIEKFTDHWCKQGRHRLVLGDELLSEEHLRVSSHYQLKWK